MTLFGDIESRLSSETLVDSFEDSDMTEYDLAADTADGAFVTTNGVIDQNQSWRVDSGTAESQYYSSTSGGLPAYYSQGDGTLRVYNYTDQLSSTDFRLAFGINDTDSNSRFDLRLEYFNDDVTLLDKTNDTALASATAVGFTANTQYRADATWNSDDTIDAVVYDETNSAQVASFSGVSTTANTGQSGLGFSSYTGGNTFTDYINIV